VTDFNPGREEIENTAAMRREGDLGRYLRDQIRAGNSRRTTPPKVVTPKPPGHRPGAWPSGTSPPGPLKPQPPGAWAAALERHRLGLDSQHDPCHCGACPPPDQHDPTEETP
jgi:hypothetical protein